MTISENLQARVFEHTETELIVELQDGSRHSASLSLFPILADATLKERANWEFIGGGAGIYWPEIDEHISVFSIVYPERTVPVRTAALERHILQNRERRTRSA